MGGRAPLSPGPEPDSGRASPSHHLFAYGTLEFPVLLEALTGRRFPWQVATLEGYERFLLKGRDYPGIVRTAGARTTGVLYTGLDSDALERLDRFEGSQYERRPVRVRAADGGLWEAVAYVVPDSRRDLLGDARWDRSRFERERLARYLSRLERSA